MAGSSPDPEADAWLVLEHARWGGRPSTCPHCGARDRCFFLSPADGRSRATRTGSRSARRVWKCGACRRQFSVLTGTVLEGSRLPVSTWMNLIAVLSSTTDVVNATDLARRTGAGRGAAAHVTARWTAAKEYEPLRGELARTRQLFQG